MKNIIEIEAEAWAVLMTAWEKVQAGGGEEEAKMLKQAREAYAEATREEKK